MSKYTDILDERFKTENPSYKEECRFLFMRNAPRDYLFEDEMLDFLETNPDATLDEAYEYFDVNVPDGLPPDFDEADFLEDG